MNRMFFLIHYMVKIFLYMTYLFLLVSFCYYYFGQTYCHKLCRSTQSGIGHVILRYRQTFVHLGVVQIGYIYADQIRLWSKTRAGLREYVNLVKC